MEGRGATGTVARIAPAVVLLGYVVRPFVSSYTDAAEVAGAAAGAPGRWLLSSVLVAAGFAGLAYATAGVVAGAAGTETRSGSWTGPAAVAASVLGATLLALQLGLMGGAVIGAAESGQDPVAAFDEITTWEGPLIGAVLLVLAVGWSCLAHTVRRAGIVDGARRRVVVAAVAVAVAGLLLPSSAGEYVSAAALIVAFWTIAAGK